MDITPQTVVNDDGTGTTGTVWNAAFQLAFEAAINAALSTGVTTAPTTTGNVTAEPIPAGAGILTTYHNNATLKTIQGMAAGVHGQLWIHHAKNAQVDVAHLHASGTALGQCRNFATSAASSMAAGAGFMAFQYDNGVLSSTTAHWRLVAHEQGDWITPTFAAGNYVGSGAQTWTLTSGDVTGQAYFLDGRRLTISYALDLTSVGGTPSTGLNISNGAWGGFTAGTGQWNGAVALAIDNNVLTDGFSQINGAGTALRLLKKTLANWTASTNLTTLYGTTQIGVL